MSNRTRLSQRIQDIFAATFQGMNDGAAAPVLEDGTVLLETGLDSLGFAILVTRLEDELGYDPFTLSAEPFYPQTFGEFVDFYQAHAPA
ncbi:MAG: acyl carrier protein [Rhodothermales bacterium]|nr:acyl carrier protein [Rhodothermales bacterium]MBO6781075.1 acyl carrier protein [Rhodothermales bacterium]